MSFTSLISSAAVSLAINCQQVTPLPGATDAMLAKAMPVEAWPQAVCAEFTPQYQKVILRVISRTGNYRPGASQREQKGIFQIDEIRAGRTRVQWHAEGARPLSHTLWLKVEAYGEAWVYRRNLKSETKLKKRHVKKQMVDLARFKGVQYLMLESPVGTATKRPVQKNQVVLVDSVSKPPLIKRNQEIIIVAKNTGIQLKTRGRALQTGWAEGDKIKVRVHGGTEAIDATVSGEKIAYVEL